MKYTIQALKNGECNVCDFLTYSNTDSRSTSKYYLYVWLIRGGEKPIVVDTGIKNIRKFNQGTQEYIPGGVRQKTKERTLQLIKSAKVNPGSVSHVILTHLHQDHYEQYPLFTKAKLIVNGKGFIENLLQINKDVMKALARNWPDSLHLAKDEEEILPGISVFWVGGHSICSQAVVVETKSGNAVITGDVIFKYRNIEENIPIGMANTEQSIAAMKKVREKADIILPGHDPEIMQRYPNGIIG